MWINVSINKKNENILVFSNKKCYNKITYARKRVDENEKNNIIHKNNNNANRLLFKYAKQQAIYGNNEVVKKCIIASKHKKYFSYKDVVVLRIYSIYGIVRPLIRKIYYKVVHKIKMS